MIKFVTGFFSPNFLPEPDNNVEVTVLILYDNTVILHFDTLRLDNCEIKSRKTHRRCKRFIR